MGFDVGSLGGVVGDLFKMAPSTNDLANQVVTGAVASVLLSGLKTQSGMDAVDPLHIIHPNAATGAGASTIVGKTLPASALATLSADQIKALASQGYSFV